MNGKEFIMVVSLAVGDQGSGAERLQAIGLSTRNEDGRIFIDNVVFGSAAQKARIDFDQEIVNFQVLTDRPPKQLVFLPAIALLALVWISQKRRIRKAALLADNNTVGVI